MRAAVYARVSTHDQQTLGMQVEAMVAYIRNRGWVATRRIEDVGSGAKERPGRESLLMAARRREIDVVVVWRLDCRGRSVADLMATLHELTELGVGFVSLTEPDGCQAADRGGARRDSRSGRSTPALSQRRARSVSTTPRFRSRLTEPRPGFKGGAGEIRRGRGHLPRGGRWADAVYAPTTHYERNSRTLHQPRRSDHARRGREDSARAIAVRNPHLAPVAGTAGWIAFLDHGEGKGTGQTASAWMAAPNRKPPSKMQKRAADWQPMIRISQR
jgi:hypothetical protein